MEEKVLIAFNADTGGLDDITRKLDENKDRERALLAELRNLNAEYSKQVQAAAAAGKSAQERATIAQKAGDDLKKKEKEIRKEIDYTRKSIEDLAKSQQELPAKLPAAAVQKSFREIRKEIENQIKTMAMAGQEETETYRKLIAEAGRLSDIQGDVQREIAGLASDTGAFDTILEGTQLMAGGFSVAQGAMALFGAEGEDVQEMMVKLQSAIAITTGLQQIQNSIQKESYVMRLVSNAQIKAGVVATELETAAKSKNIIVSKSATIAQLALNAAAKANPYVLLALAIGSVIGALYLFSSSSREAEKQQSKLNVELEDTEMRLKQIADNADFGIKMAEATGQSIEYIRKLRKEAIDAQVSMAAYVYNQLLANDNATVEQVKKAGDLYLSAKKEQQSLAQQFRIDDAKAEQESTKKKQDEAKKAADKAKQDAQARAAELKQVAQKLQDEQLSALSDGQDKEIKAIKVAAQRKLDEIKGKSQDELELRRQIEENAQNEISRINKKYSEQEYKNTLEIKRLTLESELHLAEEGSEEEAALKKQLAEIKAEIEIQSVQNSTDIEEIKAAKIKEINSRMASDIDDINDKILEKEKETAKKRAEIEKELAEKRRDYNEQLYDRFKSIFSDYVYYLHDSRDSVFQDELDKLDKYYTTDADEAKENSSKKLISEQEYQKRKDEIEAKQKQNDKNASRVQILANAADAVAKVWMEAAKLKAQAATYAAIPVVGPGLAAAALAMLPIIYAQIPMIAAQSAMQLASVNKLWKGRKGGRGELSWVGEQGPELMYIPDGASIVPNRQSKAIASGDNNIARDWDIPIGNIPELPRVSQEIINEYSGNNIDYDLLAEKIGKAMKKNIRLPKQGGNVHINVDSTGVSVNRNGNITKFRNRKYGVSI